MGLLDLYLDPALAVDASLTPEDIAAAECERLASGVAVVTACLAVPRRLSDANREELALDKRRARRVQHVLRQSLTAWGGAERAATKDEASAGAQLDWEPWCEEHRVLVQARLRLVATWAKQTSQLRFGKTAVVRLTQELEWMQYALRD